jgi:hypothetical protein
MTALPIVIADPVPSNIDFDRAYEIGDAVFGVLGAQHYRGELCAASIFRPGELGRISNCYHILDEMVARNLITYTKGWVSGREGKKDPMVAVMISRLTRNGEYPELFALLTDLYSQFPLDATDCLERLCSIWEPNLPDPNMVLEMYETVSGHSEPYDAFFALVEGKERAYASGSEPNSDG